MSLSIQVICIPGSSTHVEYEAPMSILDLLRKAKIGWKNGTKFQLKTHYLNTTSDVRGDQLVTSKFDILWVIKPAKAHGPCQRELTVYTPTNTFSIATSIALCMSRQEVLDELNVEDPKTAIWCDHHSTKVFNRNSKELKQTPGYDVVLVISENNDE